MTREIERKFLVVGDDWRGQGTATPMRQAYLCADAGRSVRVRIHGDRATLTIKGGGVGLTRVEHEFPLDAEQAGELYALCPAGAVEKTRHRVFAAGHLWEIDVFEGDNAGLILAEVELEREDEPVLLPPWVGREVSHDPRFLNARLARAPFGSWSEDERRAVLDPDRAAD